MKLSSPKAALTFGSEVIERLVPHRRPFLLVDKVEAFTREPRPGLRAIKHVSTNEPIFQGHFPRLHLWPGVYTVEGMGQACNILGVLVEMIRTWEDQGGQAEDVTGALRNLHLGYRLHPGYDQEQADRFDEATRGYTPHTGFTAAIDVKLTHSVFAGQTILYEVTIDHVVNDMTRFGVEARVGKRVVAHGDLTGYYGGAPIPGTSFVGGGA